MAEVGEQVDVPLPPPPEQEEEGEEAASKEPPRYRISLEWGDFSALFSGDLSTVRGRQERMMALGFFYGRLDGIDGPVTKLCWNYMRKQMERAAKKSFSDEELLDEVKEGLRTIVRKDDGGGAHEPDPTKDARIVFPGTFCFTDVNQLGNPLTEHRKHAEDRAWKDNLGLGRIPLVVHVEDRDTSGPAEGVKVVFEFVPPYGSAADQLAYLNGISAATERAQAPRAFVRSKLSRDPARPFGYNCRTSFGGRKPTNVHGELVAAGTVHGFPHVAETAGRPNAYSVVVKTDAEGEAGIVIRPPRTAGDCLKIRVSIHPDREGGAKLPPDADEEKTTGILTVWRQLRLSKIIVKPRATSPFGGAPAVAAAFTGALGTISTDTMKTEYAKAFHQLVVDHDAKTPKVLTAAEYAKAIEWARAGVNNPHGYDLAALVRTDFDSPFLFWLADDATYNANRAAGTAALDLTVAQVWTSRLAAIVDQLVDRFCRYFTGAAVPGVTVLRSEVGDSYSYWGDPRKPAGLGPYTTSGVATVMRGCFLWYPDAVYTNNMPYPLTVNTMHEMGHVLFLRHHYTSAPAAGGFPANHDAQDDCLMGYLPLNTNDHCGKCLLKLRGWNETVI